MAVKSIVHVLRISLLDENIRNLVAPGMSCPLTGSLHLLKSDFDTPLIQLLQDCLDILLLPFIEISKNIHEFIRINTI